jgi:uncharacterized surface anchored protein
LIRTVEDQTEARVPDARITIQAAGSPTVQREATSDSVGAFRVDTLLPGPYWVTVKPNGFQDATAGVTLVVSNVKQLIVKLRPASYQRLVNVGGHAASITTAPIDSTSAVH